MNSSSKRNQTSCGKGLAPVVLIATLLLLAGVTPVPADLAANTLKNPKVVPPGSTAYGQTYAQWSEAWFQWAFSLPVTAHPLFDTADCSAGQSGNVWFLGGTFGASGIGVVRNCTIPAGKALFFPIINNWADNTDCSNGQMISDGFTEEFLRSLVHANQDNAANLSCTIDGVTVGGLTDPINTPYRVQTPTPGGFSYVLPATDNILDFLGLTCWTDNTGTPLTVDAATYHPVGDGVYIMVKPLAAGTHTIHFSGSVGAFVEDITYNLTVLK